MRQELNGWWYEAHKLELIVLLVHRQTYKTRRRMILKNSLFGLLWLLFYHQPKYCFSSDLKDLVVILMNSVEVVMKLLHDGILPEKVIIGLINEYKN